jgi:hypothetical protein
VKATTKIAVFAIALAVVFAAAFGIGAAFGPVSTPAGHADHAGSDGPVGGTPELPAGLAVTQHGYTLQLGQSLAVAGPQVPLRFVITGPSGAPVTDYTVSHTKELHLIVVRRDLTGFQHVHPVRDAAGTWSVRLDLRNAGDYRVFADFVPAGGQPLTLGADLHVAGRYDPQPLPPASSTTTVDGYTVTLSGEPTAGAASELTLSVSRDGAPVTDLQPYLGAYGHLVALRAEDLAYLHVHPMGEPGDGVTPAGPQIGFHTAFPSAGAYRLYLDFQHQNVVHTAEFTVTVPSHAH